VEERDEGEGFPLFPRMSPKPPLERPPLLALPVGVGNEVGDFVEERDEGEGFPLFPRMSPKPPLGRPPLLALPVGVGNAVGGFVEEAEDEGNECPSSPLNVPSGLLPLLIGEGEAVGDFIEEFVDEYEVLDGSPPSSPRIAPPSPRIPPPPPSPFPPLPLPVGVEDGEAEVVDALLELAEVSTEVEGDLSSLLLAEDLVSLDAEPLARAPASRLLLGRIETSEDPAIESKGKTRSAGKYTQIII
jgi:hypothetical protein